MFPSFIGILEIQSWWEVPSIAYFCSLFRAAFNLLDFDIEELEEALLTDGTEDSSNSLLTELIVRLLSGCLGCSDISAFNYQMFLRRLFRQKCQETGRSNPFDSDIDFQFLPLRTKVEILYALCDFRLDAEDVLELFKHLEADSLRVEPLGWDDHRSAYWYFYGTRLYREDYKKCKGRKKKGEKRKSRPEDLAFVDWDNTERIWQVVCFTESDWSTLTEKFKNATTRVEKELYQSLSQNFLPEIPRLFQEKERLQRKRLLENAPRRTSSRVLGKVKRDDDYKDILPSASMSDFRGKCSLEETVTSREGRNKRKRENFRSPSLSSDHSSVASNRSSSSDKKVPPPVEKKKRKKRRTEPVEPLVREEIPLITGRKTNNSLSSSLGQFMIPDIESSKSKNKIEKSQIQSREEIETDMYKILEQITAHQDAWPFMDPVEEEYAPNYYQVIRRPMDLKKMEKRLEEGYYKDFKMFENDFKLIVNNCRLYNGQENEYTGMVDNLQNMFDRLTTKYATKLSSSDEEEDSEKTKARHSKKRKSLDSKAHVHKIKRQKSSHKEHDNEDHDNHHKSSKHDKEKKHKEKRKNHKHEKHEKHKSHKKDKHGGKSKQKHHKGSRKKSKRDKTKPDEPEQSKIEFHTSYSSLDDLDCSRSPSPLPSIHTLSPSPPPSLSDKSLFGEGADKTKDTWQTSKDSWDSIVDYRKSDLEKQNVKIFDTDKNPKLRETIEKLKAKNEKLKEGSLFNNLFMSESKKDSDSLLSFKSTLSKEDDSKYETSSQESLGDGTKKKSKGKPVKKDADTFSVKNDSTSEALEQAVKDITMWLDDSPADEKSKDTPSPSPEPDHKSDMSVLTKELALIKEDKKLPERPEKVKGSSKKRDIQRTIERLQPGKSKGNLLTTPTPKEKEVLQEDNEEPPQPLPPPEPNTKAETNSSIKLGSVLSSENFGLGTNHNFEETKKVAEKVPIAETPKDEIAETKHCEEPKLDKINTMKDVSTETGCDSPKLSQEKATPNLSAWFKAFGAPKSTPSPLKKPEEDTPHRSVLVANVSAKNDAFSDEVPDTIDRSVSPIPTAAITKQRRTSTGSSVSERSSFSQDLDSPRHLMPHSSPLLRSPASPRTEDIAKAYVVNGTVRAGFYHDTTSVKSSPEKSCSPREAPSSPHPLPHVYAHCNTPATVVTTAELTKTTFSNYSHVPSAYYDNNDRTTHHDEQYSATSYQNTATAQKDYPVHNQNFPYFNQNLNTETTEKPPLFPMKKRYNESLMYSNESYHDTSIKPVSVSNNISSYKPLESQYTSHTHSQPEIKSSNIPTYKTDAEQFAENVKQMKSKAVQMVSKLVHAKAAEKVTERVEVSKQTIPEAHQSDPYNSTYEKYKRGYQEYDSHEPSAATNLYSKNYDMQNIDMNYTINKNQYKNPNEINKLTKSNEYNQRRHEYGNPSQEYDNVHNEYSFFNELLMRGNPASLPQHSLDYGLWKNDAAAKEKEQLSKHYNTGVTDYSRTSKASTASSTNANISYSRPNDNYYSISNHTSSATTSTSQCELKIPNPRSLSNAASYHTTWANTQKSDSAMRMSSTKYDTPKAPKYPTMTSYQNTPTYPMSLDSFRNLPSLPLMIERYAAEEKYLNPSSAALRNDMLQMTNKNMSMGDVAKSYAQTSSSQEKYTYSKPTEEIAETRKRGRKAKVTDAKPRPGTYPTTSAELSTSIKSTVPGSAFNFGAGVPLESGLYGDNSSFATNQLMAANYMAAVAQQRMSQEANIDKSGKSSAQSSAYSFPSLMRHPQVRAGFPFVGGDPTSPIYQQYLQRHQEELLRHTGAQIMGLYPEFSSSLGIHQTFDSINRPSWP